MADFDIAGARKAGYTDAEIADFLAKSENFDASAARKAGYSDGEIISHLSAPPAETAPTTPPAQGGAGRDLALSARGLGAGAASAGTFLGDTMVNNPEIGGMLPPPFNVIASAFRGSGQTPMGLASGGRFPTAQSAIEQAATTAGAPTPETTGEKLLYGGMKGAGAAAAGGAGAGIRGLGGLTRAGASGLTGGTASEFAREQGGGPIAQMLAGLGGGLASGVAGSAVNLGAKFTSNLVRPITRNGQEGIAASILQKQAGNPQAAAANLETAAEVVPGSPRTMGEASKDAGLLALEKGIRARNPGEFGDRISEQNTARQAALTDVAGTENTLEAAKAARSAVTGPMREEALANANRITTRIKGLTDDIYNRFMSKASALQDKGRFDTALSQNKAVADKPYLAVSGQARVPGRLSPHSDRAEEASAASGDMRPIIAQRQAELEAAQGELAQLKAAGASPLEISKVSNRIDGILSTPGLRASQVVQKALGAVRTHLSKIADEQGTVDARDLYTVRKEIGNYIENAAKESGSWDKKLSAGLQRDVQLAIDDAIEAAAPGFKAYLERYKEMSKPINQMEAMQEIQRRSQLTSVDVKTGENFLGPAPFSRALDAAAQEGNLTPAQLEKLNAIRTDLQYGQAINGPLVKTPGSDTFQNLSVAQVLGAGPSGPHPGLRVLARPLDWVYRAAGSDARVNEILKDAALNPRLSALLLRRATPVSVYQLSEELKRVAVSAGLGGLISQTAAPRSSPSPTGTP